MKEKLHNLCMKVELGANQVYQSSYIYALMDLCIRCRPDKVIELGTYSGTSTLALASALHLQGTVPNRLVTIDINHALWHKTRDQLRGDFMDLGISIDQIETITQDFKRVRAENHISGDSRILLFNDVHDFESDNEACSKYLFGEWMPRMHNGILAMHDVVPRPSDWTRPPGWGRACSESHIEHWAGQWFHGNGETGALIEWLNSYKAPINSVGQVSLAWVWVKNGQPFR